MGNFCRLALRGLLLVATVFIIIEMADAARGGGARYGGGSRYSSSRYSSARYRYTSNRYRMGSSRYRAGYRNSARIRVRYSSSRSNGVYIGGYPHYYEHHSHHGFTICQNYKENDGNGTALGKFMCPQFYQTEDFNYCCGPHKEQHCCRFLDDPKRGWGLAIGLTVGIIVFVLIVAACASRCKGGGGGGGSTSWSYSYDSD